jgi:ADP-ribose pyrophosphatase YjhB (NUDIX family)
LEHRIKGTAIVSRDGRLLLVKHEDPAIHAVFWVPPGGGLEGDESLLECVKRETMEETGLSVEPERIVYVKEFIEPEADRHHCELFFLCGVVSGTLTTANLRGIMPDEEWIKDVRYLSQKEMDGITVYPEALEGEFWDDLAGGFACARYLGVDRAGEDPAG